MKEIIKMNIESKINQIAILISQIQNNNTELSIAKRWMLDHNSDLQLTKIIPKLSVVAFHILDILSTHKELNGIKLAELLGVTRGGVSRATQKLLKEKLIVALHHPNNKKNIYYQLTVKGQKMEHLHQQMHTELYDEIQTKISSKFSIEELNIIIQFLTYIKNYKENLK